MNSASGAKIDASTWSFFTASPVATFSTLRTQPLTAATIGYVRFSSGTTRPVVRSSRVPATRRDDAEPDADRLLPLGTHLHRALRERARRGVAPVAAPARTASRGMPQIGQLPGWSLR